MGLILPVAKLKKDYPEDHLLFRGVILYKDKWALLDVEPIDYWKYFTTHEFFDCSFAPVAQGKQCSLERLKFHAKKHWAICLAKEPQLKMQMEIERGFRDDVFMRFANG